MSVVLMTAMLASPPVWSAALAQGQMYGQTYGQWRFIGQSSDQSRGNDGHPVCQLQVQGDVLDDAGADVQLYCANDQVIVGSIQLAVAAPVQRRLELTAELNADASMMASLNVKSLQDKQLLMFDDDTEQALFGEADAQGWQARQLSMAIDGVATEVRMGVLVQGKGSVRLRNVRIQISRPAAIAPEALSYLNDVIALLQQHTQQLAIKPTMNWSVLEPQMRVLASGASTTREVYPAIRYALGQLGDRRNSFITPDMAALLHNLQSSDATTRSITLVDGARLRLTAVPLRTAQNQASKEANLIAAP